VVRVTGNFTSESPLSAIVSTAISAAFEAGWADPKKLSQASQRAKILRNQALEALASTLGIRVDQMEIVGESELATYLCIAGFLDPSKHLSVGAIDRGKIRAFTRTHANHSLIPVDGSGYLIAEKIPAESILTLQIVNGETGVKQDLDLLASKTKAKCVILDATSSAPRVSLGDRWDGAIFNAQSWGGPAGLSLMAISNSQQWRYPLPHIAPIRTPGNYSLPLLLGAAVALENFNEDRAKIDSLSHYLRQKISAALPAAIIVGENSERVSSYHTIIFPGTVSEMLVRELEASAISVDAGSACSPADLAPSHVLAAMGLPTEGSLRLTLRQDHTEADIDALVSALVEVCRNF
jgi:cysteine desulfurase